ncbi:MAG: DinB family protein [Anaerolineae bacterium]|nr:DinB family protein [Anaerolineae bacterium]
MSTTLTDDLHDQFSKALAMLRFTIEQFSPEEYLAGMESFDAPARIAWHTVESLDFYFSGKRNSKEFSFGHRFDDTPSWKLVNEDMPDKPAMLQYLNEMEAVIDAAFAELSDEKLSAPFELYDWSGKTLLGHYVYAIRHTMEHQGALTVIATHFGHTDESWR